MFVLHSRKNNLYRVKVRNIAMDLLEALKNIPATIDGLANDIDTALVILKRYAVRGVDFLEALNRLVHRRVPFVNHLPVHIIAWGLTVVKPLYRVKAYQFYLSSNVDIIARISDTHHMYAVLSIHRNVTLAAHIMRNGALHIIDHFGSSVGKLITNGLFPRPFAIKVAHKLAHRVKTLCQIVKANFPSVNRGCVGNGHGDVPFGAV